MKRTQSTEIEWIAGIFPMPTFAGEGNEAFQPEVLLWLGAEGAVLGHALGKPGEMIDRASDRLSDVMAAPSWGQPHVPSRIRVSSPELADALRAGHPGLQVVCAATPELDQVVAAMSERLGTLGEPTYLTPGVSPEAIAALFRAAAGLYRAQPWTLVPDDECLLCVSIARFDLRDAAISVIGQNAKSRGFVLFSGLEDFEAFLEAADAIARGDKPVLPPHFSLSFCNDADLPAQLRTEISEQGWEVASAEATPSLLAIDEDSIPRDVDATEVTIAEAISLALIELVKEEQLLTAAWEEDKPFERTLSVHTADGDVEVTLRAPYAQAEPVDIIAEMQALDALDDELDPRAHERLVSALERRFADSRRRPAARRRTALLALRPQSAERGQVRSRSDRALPDGAGDPHGPRPEVAKLQPRSLPDQGT